MQKMRCQVTDITCIYNATAPFAHKSKRTYCIVQRGSQLHILPDALDHDQQVVAA